MDKETKLSKSILDMKFMKKSKEKVLKQQEDAEGQAMYSNEITEEMKKAGNIIFREASITICKGLVDGRLSFGGMNVEIEKMMENNYNQLFKDFEQKKEKDITDEEMAKGYSAIHAIESKFKSKKNKKFQKPPPDDLM